MSLQLRLSPSGLSKIQSSDASALNGDYLNTYFTKLNVAPTSYNAGDGLDYAPKYMFTASSEREFTWDSKPGILRLDYAQTGP
jgi:hypothetical protein